MKIIHTEDPAFAEEFLRIRQRGKVFDEEIWAIVRGIVTDVMKNRSRRS
jgi:hypothetical protein